MDVASLISKLSDFDGGNTTSERFFPVKFEGQTIITVDSDATAGGTWIKSCQLGELFCNVRDEDSPAPLVGNVACSHARWPRPTGLDRKTPPIEDGSPGELLKLKDIPRRNSPPLLEPEVTSMALARRGKSPEMQRRHESDELSLENCRNKESPWARSMKPSPRFGGKRCGRSNPPKAREKIADFKLNEDLDAGELLVLKAFGSEVKVRFPGGVSAGRTVRLEQKNGTITSELLPVSSSGLGHESTTVPPSHIGMPPYPLLGSAHGGSFIAMPPSPLPSMMASQRHQSPMVARAGESRPTRSPGAHPRQSTSAAPPSRSATAPPGRAASLIPTAHGHGPQGISGQSPVGSSRIPSGAARPCRVTSQEPHHVRG